MYVELKFQKISLFPKETITLLKYFKISGAKGRWTKEREGVSINLLVWWYGEGNKY